VKEINDARPTSIRHLIGQRGVIAQVEVALDAAQQDNKKFDDALLVGPPGLGKSQLASVIAQEMASDFHDVLGQTITSNADLNALLLRAKQRDVVHIDECHELAKPFQTALYLAIDQRKVIVSGRNTVQSIPLQEFTLLLSTTDEYCLLQPLRDRMKLVLRLDFYSEDDLVQLLRSRIQALGWSVDGLVLGEIAKRSRGTPRLALRLLQSCRRYARSKGDTSIDFDHLKMACQLESLDEVGCGPMEQKYLAVLVDGACRLNVIASRIGLPTRTITEVIEPYLIRADLVCKDDQGRRELTALGREHVQRQICDPSL